MAPSDEETVAANERTRLVSPPPPSSPTEVKDYQLQKDMQELKQVVQEAIRRKVELTTYSKLCIGFGTVAAFSVCLILVMGAVVLLSDPKDQDALCRFAEKSWPWLFSFFMFSSFTTVMIWTFENGEVKMSSRMESKMEALQQTMKSGQQTMKSGQQTIASKLDALTALMTRQHQENNGVMKAADLVTAVHAQHYLTRQSMTPELLSKV